MAGAGTPAGDAKRRARDLVEVVQPSDRLAFAALQLELGHDLELVREKLQLDADQLATIRQRLRYAEKPPKPRRKRKRRGKPPVAGWR